MFAAISSSRRSNRYRGFQYRRSEQALVLDRHRASLFGDRRVERGRFDISRRGVFSHPIRGARALALGVFFFLLVFLHVKTGKWPNATQMMYTMVVIITCTACIAQWLAYSISETSEFDQDVILKSETITDAKVIIVLSRFTILLKDKMLHVVPTADITKFQTKHPLLLIVPTH